MTQQIDGYEQRIGALNDTMTALSLRVSRLDSIKEQSEKNVTELSMQHEALSAELENAREEVEQYANAIKEARREQQHALSNLEIALTQSGWKGEKGSLTLSSMATIVKDVLSWLQESYRAETRAALAQAEVENAELKDKAQARCCTSRAAV
jgi:chromosome segregation ATPase